MWLYGSCTITTQVQALDRFHWFRYLYIFFYYIYLFYYFIIVANITLPTHVMV